MKKSLIILLLCLGGVACKAPVVENKIYQNADDWINKTGPFNVVFQLDELPPIRITGVLGHLETDYPYRVIHDRALRMVIFQEYKNGKFVTIGKYIHIQCKPIVKYAPFETVHQL